MATSSTYKPTTDLLGECLLHYYQSGEDNPIDVYVDGVFDHKLYPSIFFRGFKNMNRLERMALQLTGGKVLDVGAGTGCHASYLSSKGFEVTALENSPACIQILRKIKIPRIVECDFFSYDNNKFDTILMLMNGTGIAETLSRVPKLISHAGSLLDKGGRILIDSTDIRYTLRCEHSEQLDNENNEYDYYGNTELTLHYYGLNQHIKWVYTDPETLKNICKQIGMKCTILKSDSQYRFLAMITF